MRFIEELASIDHAAQLSIQDDADAIGKCLRFVEIMRDEHDGASEARMNLAQHVVHRQLSRGVESRERFVEDEDLGADHERAGKRCPL